MVADSVFALKTRPSIIGHRGCAAHEPENTMRSFKRAVELGAHLLECDVHLSRDGKLVVIHDDTVDRTTGAKGLVSALTLVELQQLDAGRGEKIPLLDELLDWLIGQEGIGLAIEIKPSANPDAVTRATVAAVRERGLSERVIIISFDQKAISASRRFASEIFTGFLYHDTERVPDPVAMAQLLKASALLPYVGLVTRELVDAAHLKGLLVFTWTANTPEQIEKAFDARVDGIASDAPDIVAHEIVRITEQAP